MFKIIHISPVSVSFEADNNLAYYNDGKFDIYVNGLLYRENEDRNVFTVFGLEPGTEYTFKIANEFIQAKTIPVNRILNVLDYGVKNDGMELVTEEIQAVLDDSVNDLIVFPEGKYYTAPLNFSSNTYVLLEKGAEILGSVERSDYPVVPAYSEDGTQVNGTWEGEPNDVFMSLITSVDSHDIMFIGEGTINGNADEGDWWINPLVKRVAWRGNNVFLNRCKNISFVGLNIINSPAWNIHPFYSQNLDFIDLTLRSIPTSPNTDGFDPESCSNIRLLGTRIYVGDDCVAIKSGKKIMADKFYQPCTNITIRNCFMGDGHGGVVFGSESSCGIQNVDVTRCIFKNTDRGLRIKTKRGRGNKSQIENVNFDNIIMDGVMAGFVINMYYYLERYGYDDYADSKEYRPYSEMTPHVGEFRFKNIQCLNTRCCAGYFYGLPESKISKIILENIHVTFDENYKTPVAPAMIYQCEKILKGTYYFYNVEDVIMNNVRISG